MTTEHIVIANISCGGCINTITKKLSTMPGVENVHVDLETSSVSVLHNETENREALTKMLFSLGYPEATEKNGLLTQLKSLGTCLSGKLSN